MDRSAPPTVFPEHVDWNGAGTSRVPFLAYTSNALPRRSSSASSIAASMALVGLEAEIPNPGDSAAPSSASAR